MASVFELLDEIEQRPGMYFGGGTMQRILQLQKLETAREFAMREGLRPSTLLWWSSRLGRGTRGEHGAPEITAIEIAVRASEERPSVLPRTLLDGIARELRDGHLGRGAVLTK
jgi:hypothetical protein